MLKINNLNFSYNKKVLNNINLSVEKGDVLYLLGPSGCGKTSLLNLIAGFDIADSGNIVLENKDITKLPPQKRKIGIVFQDFALFPNMSVKENIVFALQKLEKNTINKRLNSVVELLDIADIINKYPHQISGGQAQRVALARSMALRPKIILFDEIFSSLDENLKYKLTKQIRYLLKDEGITAIFVSHDQKEALSTADKIAVMKHGKIVQFDSSYNIYHKPNSKFVANFIGDGYFINATIINNKTLKTELGELSGDLLIQSDVNLGVGDNCYLLIRPDDIIHDDNGNLEFEILDKTFYGQDITFILKLPNGQNIPATAAGHHNHQIGKKLKIKLDIDHLIVFDK